MLWRRVGHYAEQAGLQVPLEDASVGWLEPLGHLFWEVLEGKGLILFRFTEPKYYEGNDRKL